MTFEPGDPVHVAALGKGIVREARNAGRYLVEIKGRTIVVDGHQLAPAEPVRTPRRAKPSVADTQPSGIAGPAASGFAFDRSHGMTVDEGSRRPRTRS